ncbi:uncharacterized protein LOC5517346 isoform X3 [Nematostella vectensis]|uniref:uncharacterized protein LOC5517346 isoform X3 n=1 Tax=Nematostella vectensis TaxID=45351 RepID=UPI0020770F89|nr:uncharacterized protein LOC5517346 isoform X3 [Nematostella vectensis]
MKIRKIEVPAAEVIDGYAVYYVEVFITEYSWLVRKRYREFRELHDKLVKEYHIDQSLLPPKKYFGNLDPDYIETRRLLLEIYLHKLLEKFEDNLPDQLDNFLEGFKYDVCGVTYNLAKELFETGDKILLDKQPYTFTPLQLYCITKRLALPVPTCDVHNIHAEIGNLYDFIQNLSHLKIVGKGQQFHLSDNVDFKYDLSLFKSLSNLEVSCIEMEAVQGLCQLLTQLKSLTVHQSAHLLKDVLVDDKVWEQGVLETVRTDGSSYLTPNSNFHTWTDIRMADFSNNHFPYIDESVSLLPNIESLNLSHNCIEEINHLESLSELEVLDLSHNKLRAIPTNLNAKLGNIRKLNLANNQLSCVDGLEKLYSLVELDLRSNLLTEVSSVVLIGDLPCLENLHLEGNPLTKESSYRVRVLSGFGERARLVSLDGQPPSDREMKKVSELLSREQDFEIINIPQSDPSTSTKKAVKKGAKKKNVDRIIELEGSKNPTSGLTDSFEVDESDAEFRSRVEKIRLLGGEKWLTMLGEIQSDEASARSSCPDMEQKPSKEVTSPPDRPDANETPENHASGNQLRVESSSQENDVSSRSDSFTSVAKVSGVGTGGPSTEPPRLHFGFTCELEELIRENLERDLQITSGTYMVEVASATAGQWEERMVGVDLCKGLILEIVIASGRTCARHKLDDVSSVDILDFQGSYHIDIQDTYSKEWRRHRAVLPADHSQTKDYRQVARYRMRSIRDAAELFVLLYKFITKSWESSNCIGSSTTTTDSSSKLTDAKRERWANPLGVPDHVLDTFFEEFLHKEARQEKKREEGVTAVLSCHDGKDRVRSSRIHSIYQALHADFIHAGALKHDRLSLETESVRLAIWVGCLPYAFPEHELPVCLMMTQVNIFLFHLFHSNSPVAIKSLRISTDLHQVMKCFYSMPVRSLNQVVMGLYDQGFRLEVKSDGPQGTFTFLTRDSEKTGLFLERLYEALGESSDDENSLFHRRVSFKSKISTMPSFIFPDEKKIETLKTGLNKAVDDGSRNEDMLMYTIVRELPDISTTEDRDKGMLTRRLRSLIVMNSRIFLCDEDHVHWPLPSFVRAQPSTPQWVVSKWQDINKIIGIEVFQLQNSSEFVGMFGLSLMFDDDDVADETTEGMPQTTSSPNCWNLVFRSLDEREQLQRSLSQVWKDHFEADLNITTSTHPRILTLHSDNQSTDLLGFHDSCSSVKSVTPVGTPVESTFKKTHRRVGSDTLPIFRSAELECFESLVALDRKSLDNFFRKHILHKTSGEQDTLLHVLWTGCIPYKFPSFEIQSCVLLSNVKVYILVDFEHKGLLSNRSCIKLRGAESNQSKAIYFKSVSIKDLKQVCVGLFDQTVRLEGGSPDDTFTLVTRDFNLTSAFLECLHTVLASEQNPSSAKKVDSSPKSIYDSHAVEADRGADILNGVKFVYPCDDTLEILKDSIAKFSQESDFCTALQDVTILVYLLVFHVVKDDAEEPKTLVIMDRSLCLCVEDHVHYPLTLFATGLPENPQHRVWDVRDVENLSRVEFTDFNSCSFTLVFSDTTPKFQDEHEDFDSASMGELCVITHFMAENPGETTWKIIAPTYEEKEKALNLICKLWGDIRGGVLPVVKAVTLRL